MNRRWEIDALRGLMLVLMTVTHLPTRLSDPLVQPFGFVSAAEGFVLLSAYMAARVYAGIAQKQGIGAMHQAFWRRALKLYGCHALLLLFLFNEVVSIGLPIDQLAIKNLASFYLAQPLTALLPDWRWCMSRRCWIFCRCTSCSCWRVPGCWRMPCTMAGAVCWQPALACGCWLKRAQQQRLTPY